ncbi:MAG TPA: hypothetical protein VJW94_19310 [Candidatus Acidoferrum sp.]|nr:hypothetical protein [Candidatus Acidoferrum sp.]
MNRPPIEVMREGCTILDPVMSEHGFCFTDDHSGRGSGGDYASAAYVNADRKLEIHYRYSLGLVTYHFGQTCIDHESYMHALLGDKRDNRYPGFSDDPLAAFRDLAYDLQNLAAAFLEGDFKQFSRCAAAAEQWKKIPGIARLP